MKRARLVAAARWMDGGPGGETASVARAPSERARRCGERRSVDSAAEDGALPAAAEGAIVRSRRRFSVRSERREDAAAELSGRLTICTVRWYGNYLVF